MSIPSGIVDLFRSFRGDRYVDTVTITDKTSRGTWNAATKQYDSENLSNVYSGGALIRPAGAGIRDRGEAAEAADDLDVYLPWDTTVVAPGQEITVTAVHAYGDTDLIGEILTVQWVTADTYKTHVLARCKRSQGIGDRG